MKRWSVWEIEEGESHSSWHLWTELLPTQSGSEVATVMFWGSFDFLSYFKKIVCIMNICFGLKNGIFFTVFIDIDTCSEGDPEEWLPCREGDNK